MRNINFMSDNKDNFGIILTILGFGFFIVSAFVIWVFLFSDFAFVHSLEPEKRIDSGIKALTTIGASFGGIALLTNAYYASRTAKAANDHAKAANENAEIARDKQITERFAKAIELLGSQQLEVKLGGIYALEQIAKDSPEKYHWTIMEVLTAFVRENASVKKVAEEDEAKILKLRTAIQAALTVIGRRNRENEQENQRLDLSNIDIRGANLYKAHLEKASLYQANLQGANLTAAKNLTSQQIELAEGDENTILPDYITRPKHWMKSE